MTECKLPQAVGLCCYKELSSTQNELEEASNQMSAITHVNKVFVLATLTFDLLTPKLMNF